MTFKEEVRKSLDGKYGETTPESVAEWYTVKLINAFRQRNEDPELIREALERELDNG
jgi:hypothetical protein